MRRRREERSEREQRGKLKFSISTGPYFPPRRNGSKRGVFMSCGGCDGLCLQTPAAAEGSRRGEGTEDSSAHSLNPQSSLSLPLHPCYLHSSCGLKSKEGRRG